MRIKRHSPVVRSAYSQGRTFLLFLLLALLASGLASCAVGIATRSLFGEKMDLHIIIDSAANNEFPLAMTMLYVYDDDMFKKLLALSAKQWYTSRAQIAGEERANSMYEAYDWEWIPGQDTTVAIPLRSSTVGALIFVNYFNDGQHRVRVEPNQDIRIRMGFDDLTVEPME